MDYKAIGLKAGLEIHQQLDTKKLFCNCPSYLRSDKADFSIRRRLHAVAGESGEVDSAVKYEASLNKEFIYQGYNDSTCLVEIDEEPPKMLNEEALREAIKIALLLNCEIYQHSQVMRKTVIDGSNTAGFQRTVLIGHDGYIETTLGKVRIDTIALEEDSARIVEEDDKTATYKLDRLGIPLVEIATAPDLQSAEHIKETALKLGEILRACKVKRGIGTIRQDLNISIKGHARVEVKGFQEPRIMLKTVELEVERQKAEIEKGKTNGEVRGTLEDGTTKFNRPMAGKARMYPETDLPLLYIPLNLINEIKKNLPKLKNEIRDELKKKGMNDELINLVLDDSQILEEFQVLFRIYNKDANLIGKMVSLWRSEFASKNKKSFEEVKEILNEKILETILSEVASGRLNEGHVKRVMSEIFEGKKVEEAIKIEEHSHDKLEEEIAKIVKEKPGLRAGGYMGLIIAKLGSGVDKRKAMEILNKLVK